MRTNIVLTIGIAIMVAGTWAVGLDFAIFPVLVGFAIIYVVLPLGPGPYGGGYPDTF